MIPRTMKAVLLTGHGGPEKLEYREDVPVPRPGAGEVLIEVGACGVNNTDIWVREGAYGTDSDPGAVSGPDRQPMRFPRIQGADTAGRIVAVGSGVEPRRVGERVIVDLTLYTGEGDGLADAGYLGGQRDGGFAEYVAVPAENAHRADCALSDAELGSFSCAYVTAERMLNRARVRSGESIVVTGASGGVGSALVQLAKLRGCRVIAIAGAGKERRVAEIGADSVVTRGTTNLPAALAAAAGGRKIDVVADIVGGAQFAHVLEALRPEGRYVSAGAIAGPIVRFDLRTMYLKHLELIGSTMGTRKEFKDLVGYIVSGRLKPLVAGTYPLKEIRRAQEDFKKKEFFGKLVILPR